MAISFAKVRARTAPRHDALATVIFLYASGASSRHAESLVDPIYQRGEDS